MKKIKILLVEPVGNFIRLDRCMQSIDSWGGVYRFPLNLARIGAHLLALGYDVRFIDLQADKNSHLYFVNSLEEFRPDLCILSSGFPSMRYDNITAERIKYFLPHTHVSTFGVAPTSLKESFFLTDTWGFKICFDSIVIGGEPALGYEKLILGGMEQKIVHTEMEKTKSISTKDGRVLFDPKLYRSPFSGEVQTYIEGSYGCPHNCSFCVVPILYGQAFSKRPAQDIVDEFRFAIEHNGVSQISLWDEGTTFQRSHMKELCRRLIELRKSANPVLQNFTWNTRSTTSLLDEETVWLMKESGLSGITLGIESFDKDVLESTGKGTTVANNKEAIRLLKEVGIISIGHIVLGLPEETKESAERTIQGALDSGLDIAQFYCAIPYPGTLLHKQATEEDLIVVQDLTKYELCNAIMGTRSLSFMEVAALRRKAMQLFYQKNSLSSKVQMLNSPQFKKWTKR